MCGIVGVFSSNAGNLESRVMAMSQAVAHRGPDDHGTFVSTEDGVAIGHRRLAILDLGQGGHQPFFEPGGPVLAYNGELYNWKALATELQMHGYEFRSSCDTEIVYWALVEYGVLGAVKRFRGMFAILLWDRERKEVWIARDRLGEKPLYYSLTPDELLVASEMQAIIMEARFLPSLHDDAVADVLQFGYVGAGRAAVPGVTKLSPATVACLSINEKGEWETRSRELYWSYPIVRRQRRLAGPAEPYDRVERELRGVVSQQLVADVPVGTLLSGGIDSTALTLLATQVSSSDVKTFTVDIGQASEASAARAVAAALGTVHTEVVLGESDALGAAIRALDVFDEPFADSSQIPALLVCETARQHVKVALSGEGGDELFCGYSVYARLRRIAHIRRLCRYQVIRDVLASVLTALPGTWTADLASQRGFRRPRASEFPLRASRALRARTDPDAFATMRATTWPAVPASDDQWALPWGEDAVRSAMVYDAQTYLPGDLLVKADRTSMSVGLELRLPFLDAELIRVVAGLPTSELVSGGKTKAPLRAMLHRHLDPKLTERPKQGFSVPMARWLRGPLRPFAEEAVHGLTQKGVEVDHSACRRLLQEHASGQRDHAAAIWALAALGRWVQRNVE